MWVRYPVYYVVIVSSALRNIIVFFSPYFFSISASYHIVRRVLTNPVWLGVTLSTVVEQSIVAAFLAFAAKYIQILFHIPAYLASIHTGKFLLLFFLG